MDTKNLACFLEVCKCGSISKAAENCFISRQGISQIIARLEEEVGCPLLTRATFGVQPTEAGSLLLEAAQEMLLSYDHCMKRIEKLSSPRELDVVFAPGAYYRLKPVIGAIRAKAPSCQINIIERVDMDCEEYIKGGDAELALVPGPIYDNTLEGKYLFSIPYVAVVRKDHPLSGKEVISLKDLEGNTVVVQGPHHKIYSYLSRLVKDNNIDAGISFVYEALLQFSTIEDSNVIGISTERVARLMMNDNMVCIPCNSNEMAWDLHVVKLKNTVLSSHAQELYDALLQFSGAERQ